MSTLERIRTDSLAARKAGDKLRANLLITLLSEAQSVGKNAKPPRESTEEEVVAVIKKFKKNANDVAEAARDNIMGEVNAYKEIMILDKYLPSQLTTEEIEIIIHALKNPDGEPIVKADMKFIMDYFKRMYPGQYDGGTVARLAR